MGLRFELWVVFFFVTGIVGVILCDPQGFLSLSCGGTATYVNTLNITWIPDDDYINVGQTATTNYADTTSSSMNTSVRSFPDARARNCYKLPVHNASSSVLVRAKFVYQNYDKRKRPPAFTLSLGRAITATINLSKADPWTEEFIWTVSKDYVPFCLFHIPNGGDPVISSLELRPLPRGAYNSGLAGPRKNFLRKCYRINCGYTNGSLSLNASLATEVPPMAVLQTARLLERKNLLTYDLPLDELGNYYIVLYFAGIVPVSSRFNILANKGIVRSNYTVTSRNSSVLHFTVEQVRGLNITLQNISFYPLINAIEVFQMVDLPPETSSTTVSALEVIQQYTGLDLGWEEDPCFPKPWNHITCDGNLVTSIELSGINLRSISPAFGDLLDLRILDLHNTSLAGKLQNLNGLLHIEQLTSGNLCLSFSKNVCNSPGDAPIEAPQFTVVPERKHRGHMHIAIIFGAVFGSICVVMLIEAEAEIRNWNAARVFSYKEIKKATNNFKDIIGKGSFGSVYLGKLPDGKMIAVKVRSDNTQLGADSFVNEVHLLSQIRHQNLVSLEGLCHESKQQILVYEYLPGGSLADSLYGSNSRKFTLNWIRRLKIAIDAAKGLHYLHNGSEPRIIHRDIKCTNILLDAQMNAKVSDFGLSKQVTEADATHVTTIVKGTTGYLDPEYYSTLQLTEKSDIYSFGVVLLELICGREPYNRRSGTPDTFNLVLWAKPFLQAGMFEVVDDNLVGDFDMESMRKAATIASRCVERDASIRPNAAEVLQELKESYSLQLAFLASNGQAS
ncbi:hypothetical protein SOVF_153340 [Spinacia oleracea]|nr:hypothetical protein SOVF_153340 [Spinacia oleracea]